MATPSNMDLFNAFTLALFKDLYESFPSPVDINATGLAMKLLPEELPNEDGMRLFRAADDAVLWLQEEGFIRIGSQSMDRGEFFQVRLTSRGLGVLDSVPSSIAGDDSESKTVVGKIGDVLSEAGKDVAKDETRSAIKALMGIIWKAAAAYAGS